MILEAKPLVVFYIYFNSTGVTKSFKQSQECRNRLKMENVPPYTQDKCIPLSLDLRNRIHGHFPVRYVSPSNYIEYTKFRNRNTTKLYK